MKRLSPERARASFEDGLRYLDAHPPSAMLQVGRRGRGHAAAPVPVATHSDLLETIRTYEQIIDNLIAQDPDAKPCTNCGRMSTELRPSGQPRRRKLKNGSTREVTGYSMALVCEACQEALQPEWREPVNTHEIRDTWDRRWARPNPGASHEERRHARTTRKTGALPAMIYDDTYNGPRYRYGLTLRPLAMVHIPKDFILWSDRRHPEYPYGTVDYPVQLSADDVSAYSLAPLGESAPHEPRRSTGQPSIMP